MKIISWNVNGIRAVMKKGFLGFLESDKPDVLCLQEVKICDKAREKEGFDEDTFPGYKTIWNGADRPGYSGTATLIKNSLVKEVSVVNGLGTSEFDIEGRSQIVECADFYVINNYFPNANNELSRLPYRLRFNDVLLKKAKKLEKIKPVLITGDFNVAHNEIDLKNPKPNVGNAGFTFEERDWMTKFLSDGYTDTFRYFYPDEVKYSWWSYRFRARDRNVGWRLDYFCVSSKIINNIKEAFILTEQFGSDHCPVGVKIKK